MCYLGMCALWSLDVGKGGGSLDFVYFWVCGIWVCVLSGLRTWARREDRPVVEAPVASTSTSRPPESDGVRRRESWLVSFL